MAVLSQEGYKVRWGIKIIVLANIFNYHDNFNMNKRKKKMKLLSGDYIATGRLFLSRSIMLHLQI